MSQTFRPGAARALFLSTTAFAVSFAVWGLVAHDFSDHAESALGCARSFARHGRSELHLLHVLPAPVNEPELAWGADATEGTYHKAARRLQRSAAPEARHWRKVVSSVRWGKPYREILSYAKENGIDLVCMGAHGANYDAQAVFGSNVDRVLRQSPCPVLAARPLRPPHVPPPRATGRRPPRAEARHNSPGGWRRAAGPRAPTSCPARRMR